MNEIVRKSIDCMECGAALFFQSEIEIIWEYLDDLHFLVGHDEPLRSCADPKCIMVKEALINITELAL